MTSLTPRRSASMRVARRRGRSRALINSACLREPWAISLDRGLQWAFRSRRSWAFDLASEGRIASGKSMFQVDFDLPPDLMAERTAAARKGYVAAFALLRHDEVIQSGVQDFSVHQAHMDLHIECFFANFSRIIPIRIFRYLHPVIRGVGYRRAHPVGC